MEHPLYRRFGKRCLDVLASIVLLFVLWPIIGLTAVMVRLRMGSPVLFLQERPGLGGTPFTIYKFRTLTDDRDRYGALLPDRARITPLGRWLRSSSLDELPQLFNVLRGDLSLVGPRPLLLQYLPLYTPDQARRMEVRPGITGWAQVNGRSALSWEEKFSMDVWYVENCSLKLDLHILAKTLWKVVRREATSGAGDVEFGGEATDNGTSNG